MVPSPICLFEDSLHEGEDLFGVSGFGLRALGYGVPCLCLGLGVWGFGLWVLVFPVCVFDDSLHEAMDLSRHVLQGKSVRILFPALICVEGQGPPVHKARVLSM